MGLEDLSLLDLSLAVLPDPLLLCYVLCGPLVGLSVLLVVVWKLINRVRFFSFLAFSCWVLTFGLFNSRDCGADPRVSLSTTQ